MKYLTTAIWTAAEVLLFLSAVGAGAYFTLVR